MTEDWDSYLCDIDGKPGSVVVDLSLFNSPATSLRPVLGRFTCKVEAPDALGFPDAVEYGRLVEDEKSAAAALCREFGCVYAGRVIHAGIFQCFFYLEEDCAGAWLAKVREMSNITASYVDADPDWGCYKNFLYPDDISLLAITNRRACEHLTELGADIEQTRIIDHAAGFALYEDAIAFGKAATDLNFNPAAPQPAAESNAEEATHPFTVMFARPDAPCDIHGITLSLDKLAKRHKGTYLGWTTALET